MSWKERSLSIILALLPIVIVLTSAYLPIHENDLDWQKAIINFDEVERVTEKFQPSQISGDMVEVGDIEVGEEQTALKLYVQSPLQTEVVVKDISVEVVGVHDQTSNSLELQEEVTIQPGEKKEVLLVGDQIENPAETTLGEMIVEMEVLGMTVEMEQ